MATPILQISGLTMDFGGIRALNRLDLDVHAGEIVALHRPERGGKNDLFQLPDRNLHADGG